MEWCFAKCLSAAAAILVMGLYANYPIALTPGMSRNADGVAEAERDYSERRVIAGSTLAARHAGTQQAITATTSKSRVTAR
jgi:hypothetical protein